MPDDDDDDNYVTESEGEGDGEGEDIHVELPPQYLTSGFGKTGPVSIISLSFPLSVDVILCHIQQPVYFKFLILTLY